MVNADNQKGWKLRVKPSALAVVIMAMALAGHAVLAGIYFHQQRQKDALALEIEAVRQSLAEYDDAARSREQRAAAEAELAAEQAHFPSWLSGPCTVGPLIQLAEENGLRLVDVKTQLGSEQQVGEHTYHALSVHVQVEGSLGALRAFVSQLENGALPAAKVDELSIGGIEPPSAGRLRSSLDGPNATEVQYSLTSSLDFSVYTRENSP